VQAKGQNYSVAEFLADPTMAATYQQGQFATIYLSPRDYHRVHMPWTGALVETVHVPGRLFSVAPFTVNAVPRLFARNERLICHFEAPEGPFVVALVGAMLVSSVETVWGGLEIPPYANRLVRKDYRNRGITLQRFQELGRFNMGSTVVLLFPPGRVTLDPTLKPDCAVKVGQSFARVFNTQP
jgi:phosphatidylserine decarboxylase